jgi:hypothetical protein
MQRFQQAHVSRLVNDGLDCLKHLEPSCGQLNSELLRNLIPLC